MHVQDWAKQLKQSVYFEVSQHFVWCPRVWVTTWWSAQDARQATQLQQCHGLIPWHNSKSLQTSFLFHHWCQSCLALEIRKPCVPYSQECAGLELHRKIWRATGFAAEGRPTRGLMPFRLGKKTIRNQKKGMSWIYPPPNNNHHQDNDFSRESLKAFIVQCYWG